MRRHQVVRLLFVFLIVSLSLQFATLHRSQRTNNNEDKDDLGMILPSVMKTFVTSPGNATTTREHKDLLSASILIPENGVDPNIWKHLSYAWTDASGTLLTKGRMETDPRLSRVRSGECPVTSQLRLDITTSNEWIVTSLDANGTSKAMGGDEYYITYRDNHHPKTQGSPTAAAYSIDRGDGTYRLDFVSPPSFSNNGDNSTNLYDYFQGGEKNDDKIETSPTHAGFLTIHFQYTCGIGNITFGLKRFWRTGGAIMTTYSDIPVPTRPKIRPFRIPNQNKQIDLAKYHKIVMLGDSNIDTLYDENFGRFPNLKMTLKPDKPLSERTLNHVFLPKIVWYLNGTISNGEQENDSQGKKYALLIGSACWDIVFGRQAGVHFRFHLQAVKELLTSLQKQFPFVDIYWHSGYALHIHIPGMFRGWEDLGDALKYMSFSRSQFLYNKQKNLISNFPNITILDFMDATYLSANHYRFGDARHIKPKFSRLLLEWYYPNYTPLSLNNHSSSAPKESIDVGSFVKGALLQGRAGVHKSPRSLFIPALT